MRQYANPPELPKNVMTPEDVVQYFAYLYLVDQVAFHPDDRFFRNGKVQYSRRNGRPLYTRQQAELRDRLMRQAWAVELPSGEIYDVALWTGGFYGFHAPEVMNDVPEWILKILRAGFGLKQDWTPRNKRRSTR